MLKRCWLLTESSLANHFYRTGLLRMAAVFDERDAYTDGRMPVGWPAFCLVSTFGMDT